MIILVLNCGSSSVKFAVIDTQTKQSISSGLVENIGVNGHVKAKGPEGNIDFNFDCPTHAEAVAEVQKFLAEQKLIDTTMHRTDGATFRPRRISAAMRRSEIRPFVQEPITT